MNRFLALFVSVQSHVVIALATLVGSSGNASEIELVELANPLQGTDSVTTQKLPVVGHFDSK